MMKEKMKADVVIKNKRATFDYELLDTFTAGIVLTGTEIKSIRLGKASLVDTFCLVDKGSPSISTELTTTMRPVATVSFCSPRRSCVKFPQLSVLPALPLSLRNCLSTTGALPKWSSPSLGERRNMIKETRFANGTTVGKWIVPLNANFHT